MNQKCKRFTRTAGISAATLLMLSACGDPPEEPNNSNETEATAGNTEENTNEESENMENNGNEENGENNDSQAAGEWEPENDVEYIAPADAGGGWDTLIRTTARVIDEEELAPVNFAPQNIPGSGGAIGWAEVASHDGEAQPLFAASPPIILVPLTETSEYDHTDFTPVANLITDYSIVLVQPDSEFESINDVFEAIEEDPGSISIGGGSAAGSMDHISIAGAAAEYGLDASGVNYVPFSGGGEAMTNLLGGHVDVVVTGVGESTGQVDSGELRPIAYSSEEPIESLEEAGGQTFIDQGIDYTFDIWRGIMGPPNMPEEAVAYYEEMYAEMLETESWQEQTEELGWIDNYQSSEEFEEFLDDQFDLFENVLSEVGLID
ncbi:tripartite tricarboxylate transporter substrate binding protein [Alkalicoccus daliensis]|uniref:Putative tricarboxylic transport membrane protein n=1 Tax=Alkalicoccus daliensis TaxID=745820 RepID=A0A1H0EBC9_9BACI|nr:tripartite tricarboxylate transporter substrate-binding protein [Alkalicoccus daliensis]SDN79606.1 putative tricarboxylic transport membrane protein [Alkalicoccus daliensis]